MIDDAFAIAKGEIRYATLNAVRLTYLNIGTKTYMKQGRPKSITYKMFLQCKASSPFKGSPETQKEPVVNQGAGTMNPD